MEFKCVDCNYVTTREDNYKRHQKSTRHIAKTKDTYNDSLVTVADVNVKTDTCDNADDCVKESVKMHSCFKCAKQYKGIKYLKNHEKKCNGLDVLTCPKCLKSFPSKSCKSHHIKRNTCKPKRNTTDYYNTYVVQQSGSVSTPIYSYIYILYEREFLDKREPIYKIGKTRQTNFKRFNSYPKGSVIELFTHCKDCDSIETALINRFKTLFEHMTNVGNEYFKGDITDMIDVVNTYVVKINRGWKGDQ